MYLSLFPLKGTWDLKKMHNWDIFLQDKQRFSNFLSFYRNPIGDSIFVLPYKSKIFFFILLFFALTPFCSIAQDQIVKSTPENKKEPLYNAISVYNEAIGKHSKILTGKYYDDIYKGINNHPFYNEIIWKIGRVAYENQEYDSIEIKYDIFKDLLLVKYMDKTGYVRPIQLYSAKVDEFHIYGHHFVQVNGDSLSDYMSGFFDLLHSGKYASVLAKRRKEIDQSTTLTSLERGFVVKDKLYIRLGLDYYEIKNRKSMFEVLSDSKSELKAFLKLNKSRFKKDHEKELIETVEYYNSIVENKGS